MPSFTGFDEFDVRPLLARGEEPLPAIQRRVRGLPPGAGIIIVAPFLPSPLIELLGSQGFDSRIERGDGGSWKICFWRREDR